MASISAAAPAYGTPQYGAPQYGAPQYGAPQYQPQPIYYAPVTQQPLITGASIGEGPARMRCPGCSADILTSTRHKVGCMTWAIIGGICAVGLVFPILWFGFQLIPCCVQGCKDVVHTCPNCRTYIGTFDRMK